MLGIDRQKSDKGSDNDKTNNRVDNLQWVSNKENCQLRWERIRKALKNYEEKM